MKIGATELLIIMPFILIPLVSCFICKAISNGRGMDGGFWWGLLGIIGIIIVAVRPNDKQKSSNNGIANAAELKQYKELLDSGAITQEEFEKKKNELLGH